MLPNTLPERPLPLNRYNKMKSHADSKLCVVPAKYMKREKSSQKSQVRQCSQGARWKWGDTADAADRLRLELKVR